MINLNIFQKQFSLLGEDFPQKKFLIAVSGGADSMVLLSLMKDFLAKLKNYPTISVAHINYHLRGEDSNLDQKLVIDFCEKHQIPYFIYEVSEKDNKPQNGSIQLWARELRYNFFTKIIQENHIDYLLTAHHLDDQLETFIINLSRGSGLTGLCGIPKYKNQIFRPMLHFTKEEIYHFAEENKIPFREDKSNKKNDYLRNKIRNTIAPLLKELSPNFISNFDKTISYLNENKEFINNSIQEFFKKISIEKDRKIFISKILLKRENNFLQYEILKQFGFENITEINKILSSEVGKTFYSKEYQLIIDREYFIIENRNILLKKENNYLSYKIEKSSLDENREQIEILDIFNLEKPKIWTFDWDKVAFPLILRFKKEGEFFSPIGMQGTKKISKFLKDEKVSILEKDNIFILADAKDEVLGILPFRQDKRKKDTKNTINQLKIIIK